MGDHAEQHGVHFDPATMQMFQAFAIFMQQQHATERREISTTKAIQAIVNKMDQFVGKDVTKYLREYVKEMALHRVLESEMIQIFELVVVPKIREHRPVYRGNSAKFFPRQVDRLADATSMYCLLWLVIVGHAAAAAAAYLPLPPAIQCNGSSGCTVENYQGMWVDRKPCKATQALYLTSKVELFNAVGLASRTGSKVKVVGSSHSYNKLVCPGGDDGIIISTQHLNSLIHVTLSSLTVTTHAGVQLRDLVERIAEFGLTLPHSPVWHSVSMAGMISTGAHGSGLWHRGSSTHDYVVGMRLITPADEEEGFAKIIDLSEQDEDLNAAKLSLDVLGAISQVTFQLEPMFKRSASLEVGEDTHLDGNGIVKFAEEHEFGEIWWYPFSGKALFKVIDRVDADTVGDGANNMVMLDRLGVDLIESLRRGLETAEESGNLGVLCQEETKMMNLRV
ncbi:hypothetical protein L7F22_007600 [Adiantum nelumboides]|nr:hypothetical protein [Adiantum nelumboides]